MLRLTEHQTVTVSPPEPLPRVFPFRASVVALDGRVIALHAASSTDVLWLPPQIPDAMLLLTDGQQSVALSGVLRWEQASEYLRFRVTDKLFAGPQRSTRLELCAPVTVAPLDHGMSAPLGSQTAAIAPDGVLLEPHPELVPETIVELSLTLPGDRTPVGAKGVLDPPREDGRVPVRFVAIAPASRSRIRSFVSAQLLARLKLEQAGDELDDEHF